MRFVQQRHRPPQQLQRPRELLVACCPLRSNVNLSRIVRAAGVCGVPRVIGCGTARVIQRIARDGAETVELEVHRSLPPVLKRLREQGYQIVGLEQTDRSECLYQFRFQRRTVLVLGNERQGIPEEVCRWLDRAVEIPVYGLPYSHNVATAAAIAMYEYCRQFPLG